MSHDFVKHLKKTSMHKNFTDSISFCQVVYNMYPKFGGISEQIRSFAGFIKEQL